MVTWQVSASARLANHCRAQKASLCRSLQEIMATDRLEGLCLKKGASGAEKGPWLPWSKCLIVWCFVIVRWLSKPSGSIRGDAFSNAASL